MSGVATEVSEELSRCVSELERVYRYVYIGELLLGCSIRCVAISVAVCCSVLQCVAMCSSMYVCIRTCV